jgi:hypothetical protein
MKNLTLLFFILFIASLVAGYTFSARFYPSDFSLLNSGLKLITAHGQKPINALGTGQRSLLLISTSTLNSLEPQLESIWLVTYFPTSSEVRLLSIYPTGIRPISDFEAQLVQSFGLEKENGKLILDQEFQSMLIDENYWWSGYIVMDEAAQAALFDLLGGIEMKGQILTGDQVLSELPNVLDEPGDAYTFQISMMQSFCKQFARAASNADLSLLSSLLNRHIITDLQPDQLKAEFQSFIAGEGQPACKFPMLEKSQIVQ